MTNKQIAAALRSAASAVEHGRNSTARKKLEAVTKMSWFKALPEVDAKVKTNAKVHPDDIRDGYLDRALDAAEDILVEMMGPDSDADNVAEMFEQHIGTHLAVELSNIQAHGHKHDDPDFEEAI